ncbi:sigma-70 family RNA polymerase sigma factor [Pontiellaceae bacterium B12227]|nr:sigma-70 family RNA polymerase sigma factor [Pontiellaceae bacterium B12227]
MKLNESSEGLTAYCTRASLLLRLKESGDDETWREFYGIYGRMIFGYALRHGLSHAEAEDVVQNVCVKLFRHIFSFNYSSELGMFRGWLKTVTNNAVFDYLRRRQRRAGLFEGYRDHAEVMAEEKHAVDESVWQAEWQKSVFDTALQRVYGRISESSRKAFHLFAVENMPAGEVAARLGIEPNAVYACKHRILKQVRAEVELLKDEI